MHVIGKLELEKRLPSALYLDDSYEQLCFDVCCEKILITSSKGNA